MITDDGGVIKTFVELDLLEFDDEGSSIGKSSTQELIEKEVYDAVSFKPFLVACLFAAIPFIGLLNFLSFDLTVLLRN